jgi:CheY-like chemotaxis protein
MEPRLQVLVIDDCRDTADTLAMLVELWGYDVAVAHDGQEALTAAGARPPDVVLLDIKLPGETDGYEVARRLRGAGLRRTLLVAVTGMPPGQVREPARDAGFDFCLVKPVDPQLLQHLLADRRALLRG